MAEDPVCGMDVDPSEAREEGLVVERDGEEYFFCSADCRDEFTGGTPWYRTERFAALFPYALAAVLVGGTATAIYIDTMVPYMGLFFLVFSLAKMPDWDGFTEAFTQYDLLAQHVPGYARIYPALEFGLGLLFLAGVFIPAAAAVTFVIMSVGALGVLNQVFRGHKMQCACLGTWMNLPLTKVTLLEDILMAGMALIILAA
ncbi:MAG: YHS domain-containing protein [Candidatus Nanohaloarchaea archaeon]|nr:YHS domain-containing protein [Candidatus Nanohaloarchaea archaeon]